jgi:hypothetical protein
MLDMITPAFDVASVGLLAGIFYRVGGLQSEIQALRSSISSLQSRVSRVEKRPALGQ